MDFWTFGLLAIWTSDLQTSGPMTSGHPDIQTSGYSYFWPSGLLVFGLLAFGLLAFFPNVPKMSWDILELLCRLHQSQIPNVLPAVCSSVSYYYYCSRLLKALLGSFCFAVTHHFRGHTHTQQCNDTSQQFFWHHHHTDSKNEKA